MITIYGVSDDLIEVEGHIDAEFSVGNLEPGFVIVCSDGTALRARYDSHNVWRFERILVGTASLEITEAPYASTPAAEGTTDRVVLDGPVGWVVVAESEHMATPTRTYTRPA